MSETDYTNLSASDITEDTEQYLENERSLNNSNFDLNTFQDSEVLNSEDQLTEKKVPDVNKTEVIRMTKLPMARIKNIMKMDPDVGVVNAEAVFLVTKATELFLETIAKEIYTYTAEQKRKTITKKDLDVVTRKVESLCFLVGAIDF